jgi:undecaprenyl-phosphate galactose phosphotransferase
VTSALRPRSSRPRSVSGFGLRPLGAGLALAAADWCAVFACLAAIWWLRDGPLRQLLPGLGPVDSLSQLVVRLYGLAPWMLAFAASRLYTRRTLFWDETRSIVYACTLAALFAVAVSFAEKRAMTTSRLVIGGLWLTTIVVVPLAREQAKRLLAALGLWRKRVLIVGAGETGMQVLEKVRQNSELGYVPVAFVDDDPTKIGTQQGGLPVRGPLGFVPREIEALDIEDVVVAIPELPRARLLHLIALCEGQVQSIRLVPDLFGLASVGVEAEDLDGVLLLHMRWNLAKPWNLLVKRLFDLGVASAVGLLLAPVLIATAIAIRVDSPGPIFFVQERLGRGRRRFACIKFRTMYADNEARLRLHLADNHGASAEWEEFAKLKSVDPRVTRVGRFLRRSSLDELPQLINVMRREMSLVGPRPYLPSETERMGDLAETILKAPPGVTGLWQVSGRNNLPFEQRVRLDEYYVRNWSLWLDVEVLMKTVRAVLRGDGAY